MTPNATTCHCLLPSTAWRLAVLAPLAASVLLAGCGGDVSWCYTSDDGTVSAGYNTGQYAGEQCLPEDVTKEEGSPSPSDGL